MKPKVTVIVPLYRQHQYLPDCVDSVLAQTYGGWEMIIVVDGSDDPMDAKVAKIQASRDKRISVVEHSKNLGLAATRNTGVYLAKTRYILPLDADDLLGKDALSLMVLAADKKNGDFIYCDYQFFGTKSGKVTTPDFDLELLKRGNYIVATSLIKKEDLLSVGGYDEDLTSHEDWLSYLKLGIKGLKGYRIPNVLFYYRQKDVSMITEARKHYSEIYPLILKKAGL